METESSGAHSELGLQLDELRRAELLTHTRYPRLGRWYPVMAGAVASVWISAYAAPLWLQLSVWVLLLGVLGTFVGWYVNERGVVPRASQSPRRLRNEMVRFFVGMSVCLVVVATLFFVTRWWVAAVVGGALAALGVAAYEHRFSVAAVQIEIDAGIGRGAS